VAVLVATISSLKLHGGIQENELATENISAVKLGLSNLMAHIDSLKNNYKLPVVVTLNKYKTDTQSEIDEVINRLNNFGIKCVVNDVWAQGGKGAIDLAKEVLKCGSSSINQFEPLYQLSCTTTEKIEKICKQVYGASSVEYSNLAMQKLEEIKKLKLDNLPVVIAKTQFSLSDNKNLLGRPENFAIHITDLQIKTGAGFVVALAGNMLLMPGLSKTPNATNMKIDGDGTISGLI
jgi:formate--tetrahydrofolate ligase